MALSYNLLSEFAKITNDKQVEEKKNTAYGTIIRVGTENYVKIDGSELLTPYERTVSVKEDDRVIVTIEDHKATVTGSTTNPSYSKYEGDANSAKILEVDEIISQKITTDEIVSINGYFEKIEAYIGKYEHIEAIQAEIEKLKAMYIEVDHINAKDIEAIYANIEKIKAEIIEADVISAEDIDAINGEFQNLYAYSADFVYVSAEILRAIRAQIKDLDVEHLDARYAKLDFANIAEAAIEKLKADFASIDFANIGAAAIDNLKAKMINVDFATINNATIDSLNNRFANIDFANIGEAAIKKIFADSGIIKDIIIQDGHITGELVGVTIKGDLIEGNTIIADKLVVKGDDGLYYKLNTDGEKVETQQTDRNSLNGEVITAKSITATKINVKDLVAFDATIGGFNITDHAIYSGVKSSVNNNTNGMYMDDEGQMALGDAFNYLKYYKVTNPDTGDIEYKLELSADKILFKTGEKSLDEAIDEIRKGLSDDDKTIITTIKNVTTQYAKNSDDENPPTTGWTIAVPTLLANEHLWIKNVVTYNNDTTTETDPLCLSKFKGPLNTSIDHVDNEYYLSSSKRSVKDGEWQIVMPKLFDGKYLWTRLRIYFTDSTIITTDPVLAGLVNTSAEELEKLASTMRSEFQSIQNGWEMSFEGLEGKVDENKESTDNEFATFKKYIRFVNGNIHLGDEKNPVELRIENDQIAFYQQNEKLAYFSNNKLMVNNADISTRLDLGNFAFIPQSNGSLTFNKVVK